MTTDKFPKYLGRKYMMVYALWKRPNLKMSRVLKLFKFNKKLFIIENTTVNQQLRNVGETASKSIHHPNANKTRIGPFGWILLTIPASTFGLGTWQVYRKKWKENLMAELHARTDTQPFDLPRTLEEINELEYYPVHVRGHFLHEKEIHLGPRSLIKHGQSATESGLISKKSEFNQGHVVITPFKLTDRPETILVNRGWVSKNNKDPRTRHKGNIEGEVDLVGLIRLHENRPNFMPHNKPVSNVWFYRDLDKMCEVTGADPIFLDATDDFDVPDGPIGGQTRITLRNEHLSYIITWYSLSIATSYMWYKHFIKGVK